LFKKKTDFLKYEKINEMHIIFFLKKTRFKCNALRGIDAMQETSNKCLDAILEALRQLMSGGRA